MTVKWAIIGCGDVAEHKTGPAFRRVEGADLVAVMGRNPEKARDFAERHHIRKHYSSMEKLLADEEIDAVYVSTPNYLHAEQTIKAAERGKHVLCEKPMALTIKECRRMIRACQVNEVKLMIAYYQRFQPFHQRIKEIVDTGVIGSAVSCRAQVGAWGHPEGWFRNLELSGGGVLMNVGCHIIDLLRYLLGDIVEVSGFADSLVFQYRAEDVSSLLLRLANGCHGLLSLSYDIPYTRNEIDIFGTKGKVHWPIFTDGPVVVRIDSASGHEEYEYSSDKVSQRVHMIRHFVDCLRTGGEPLTGGPEGLKDQQVLMAAYESARRGRVMRI